MLKNYGKSKSKSKPNTLEDIADRAFIPQTQVTKSGILQYAKPDVQEASLAHDAYFEEKSNTNLNKFQEAVEVCAKNDRAGFIALNKALLKLLQKNSAVEPDNDKKKIAPK